MGELAGSALPALFEGGGEALGGLFGGGAEAAGEALPAVVGGGAEAAGEALPAIAQGAGEGLYYLPQAGAELGQAATSLTVPALGAGELGAGLAPVGGGFFDSLSSFFGPAAGAFGGLATGLGNMAFPAASAADFGGAIPTAPTAPTDTFAQRFNASFPDAAGGLPSQVADTSGVGTLPMSQQPVAQAPAGGSSPGQDPLTAVKRTPLAPLGQGGDSGVQNIAQGTQANLAQGTTAPAASAGTDATKGSSIWDTVAKFAAPAVGAAGLAYNIANRNPGGAVPPTGATAAQQSALAGQAAGTTAAEQARSQTLFNQGQQLTQPLLTGQLPPGYQAAVDQATQAAIATAKSNAIKAGMPGDPSKNTVLASQIADIQRNATIQATNIAGQLAQTGQNLTNTSESMIRSGISASGLQQQIYDSLIRTDQAQSAAMSKAIANFAASLSGKPSSINIGLGGGTQ